MSDNSEIEAQKAAVEARKKARLAKKAKEANSDAEAQKAAVEARKKARLAKKAKEAAEDREEKAEAIRAKRAKNVAKRKQQAKVEKEIEASKARMAKRAAEKAAEEALRSYTVKSGDTLGAISQAMLGNANRYNEIFELNKDVLDSPSAIFPGQELKIPAE